MATFHVYVEGAVDASPDGVRKLANAIAQRYGLPAADLLTRLTAGRFRVKAHVDKVTAEAYVRALEDVGARVTIEESDGRTSNPSISPVNLRGSTQPPPRAQATTPPHGQAATTTPPPSRTSTPALGAAQRSGASSLPPANRPGATSLPPANRVATPPHGTRSGATSLPPATAPAVARTSSLQSGLAAAYSGGRAQSESGFDALGSGALSLSSVDGADDAPAQAPAAAFGPPPEAMAVSLAPEPAKAPAPKSQPLDLFAPPDAEEAEAKVELAADEIEHRAKKMSTPPMGAPVASQAGQSQPIASVPNTPAMRRSNPSLQPPNVPAPSVAAPMPRGRFAAGVLLSIVIGFVPAHFIAASRESTAFGAIDAQIESTQSAVEDEDAYRALDGFRSAQLAKKKSAQRTIAWQSMLIWAAVGAACAYVYFRRIPWTPPKTA